MEREVKLLRQERDILKKQWASIFAVAWFSNHGLWAYNEEASILRADGDYQWETTGTYGYGGVTSSPAFWSDAGGALRFCDAGDVRSDILRWTGDEWIGKQRDPLAFLENVYPPPRAVLPDVAIFTQDSFDDPEYYRSFDDGDTWEDIPLPDGLPSRVSVNDLAVVGDVVYLATDMGLYISNDVGDSWKPVVE